MFRIDRFKWLHRVLRIVGEIDTALTVRDVLIAEN